MHRVRRGQKWLKQKLLREQEPNERKLSIVRAQSGRKNMNADIANRQGPPTNFRREEVTFGIDVDGKTVLIETAREDAQAIHSASKNQLGLQTHARKVSAGLTHADQTVNGNLC